MADKYSSKEYLQPCRFIEYTKGDLAMLAMLTLIFSLGYGAGFEGYDGKSLRFGLYTPNAEYGYVVNDREIYLDTVFEKK
jgi:hypothetical protein